MAKTRPEEALIILARAGFETTDGANVSLQKPGICYEFPEQRKSMAAADPSLLYKLLPVIYHHIS